jgi:hypothetical protein
MGAENIPLEVESLYKVVPLQIFRRTPGVYFDVLPISVLPRIDAIDRVLHDSGAVSPGPVGDIARPWYMHPYQDDNLIVLYGTRYVDTYTPRYGKMESFVVTPNLIKKADRIIYNGPAMLIWPHGVFHRIKSSDTEGSASLNFAVHYPGFDIRKNFSIYDLDLDTGHFHLIRQGHLDQQF